MRTTLFPPILTVTLILVLTSIQPAVASTWTYGFDDGTFQGWTKVIAGNQLDWTVTNSISGARGAAQSGDYQILSEDHDTRDIAHDTLWLRSPEFTLLGGAAEISFYLVGGNFAALPANASLVPGSSSSDGNMGVALRRVSDGAFVLTDGVGAFAGPNNWQLRGWTTSELAPYVNDTYTLDLIDYRDGAWAHIQLDTVSISTVPEPASGLLLALAVLAGRRSWRRRS